MSEIDKVRQLIRDIQEKLFNTEINPQELFKMTLDVNDILDKASIEYNKYLNEKNK